MSENTEDKENTNPVSFWSFLENNTIEIPKIQRDYAQGREGKADLREKFLKKLKEVLDGKKVQQTLDFVYGAEKGEKIHVLDGQQRLTTLWLLHWYVALRAGKLNDDCETCETLKKFSYETRTSSSYFCKNLCNPDNFNLFKDNDSIVDFIQNQTWFYSEWKQDPTISSMLRMLGRSKDEGKNKTRDNIEKVFETKKNTKQNEYENWWNRLMGKEGEPPFVFYYLSLGEFRLSDDLYIKMNARGKPLTSFENLKADLIGYIEDKATEELEGKEKEKESWGKLKENLPQKLDTDWTDIFWKNKFRENEEVRIDEIYFAFINRFFWNELFVAKNHGTKKYIIEVSSNEKEENSNASYEYLNKDDCDEYNGLGFYRFLNGEIPLTLFEGLETILDNCPVSEKKLPCAKWIQDFNFIPKYTKDKKNNKVTVEKLNQRHRILFFSLCKYFKEGKADKTTLERWMRVVCNLVSGKDGNGDFEIRSTESMRRAIEFIDKLDSHNVYKSLVEKYPFDDKNKSAFDQRCEEEIRKANKIFDIKTGELKKYDGKSKGIETWEGIIKEAEEYAFFNGAIRFLYQDEKGKEDWDQFDEKFKRAKSYFKKTETKNNSCLNDNYDNAELLKIFISWLKIDKNKNARGFASVIGKKIKLDNTSSSWRHHLLSSEAQEAVHKLLVEKGKKRLSKKDFITENFCKDDSSEKLQYLLSTSGLLDKIIGDKETRGARIHRNGKHNYMAIYPGYGKNGVILGENVADNFLSKALKYGVEICEEYHGYEGFNKKPLFGFNRYFRFEGDVYCWRWKDDYVFLQSKDKPFCESEIRDKAKRNILEKCYCFYAKGLNDSEIIEKMRSLKAEHNSDKKKGKNSEE